MSYRRSFNKRISVYYSGSVSYPASQNGGSVSYSGTAYENVTVNVEVDTDPFDNSISNCNRNVNALTGAVVATETAQVASIKANSKKVAGTIIDGFFGYIRSEISQQVMELSQKLDAHLLHLRELGKSCVAKQKQMETDYNRLSRRYLKVFEDLNKELENRIFELNKPAFVFKRNNDNHAVRTIGNDLVSTVTVFGSESGELQAKISASIAKKRALDAINRANKFLWKQKKLQSAINQSMLKQSIAATQYLPVCLVETNDVNNQLKKEVYQPGFFPQSNPNEIIQKMQDQTWVNPTLEQKTNIQRYFNSEVKNAYTSNNLHDERVKEMLVKLFDVSSIKMLNT